MTRRTYTDLDRNETVVEVSFLGRPRDTDAHIERMAAEGYKFVGANRISRGRLWQFVFERRA